MRAEHFAAVKTRLEEPADLAGRVEDTARRTADGKLIRDQYLILFGGGPDDLDDNRFTKPQDTASTAEFVYTVRAVAVTAAGCRALAESGWAQLVGARLEITGRKLDVIRHTHSEEVRPDNSTPEPLFYCDDEYTLISRRA